jgi:hypothetical protein
MNEPLIAQDWEQVETYLLIATIDNKDNSNQSTKTYKTHKHTIGMDENIVDCGCASAYGCTGIDC